MRTPAAVTVLLLLAVPALAHGEGPKHFSITDEGCSLTAPPCILADDGSSVEPGTQVTVEFTNRLAATQEVMVHLDMDGAPGSLVAQPRPVEPGQTLPLTFDVPADATGVWYMTLQDGDESARLFGPAAGDHHDAAGEDSPGAGVLLLLGVLGLAAAWTRGTGGRKP